MQIASWIGDVLIIFGAINFAVCAQGLLYFRDVYARISVLGTTSGFGVSFVIIGVILQDPTWRSVVLGLAAIVLMLGTSSIATILVARAALLRRTTVVDAAYHEADLHDGRESADEDMLRLQALEET